MRQAREPRDIHEMDDREHRQETLIARLREEVAARDSEMGVRGPSPALELADGAELTAPRQ